MPYLIKNSELTGFAEGERAVIANIARYHRSSPSQERPDFAALNTADRDSWPRALGCDSPMIDRSHGRVRELNAL